MYRIYTGVDEYYLSEQNPSESHMPNEVYDKVYIKDSEGRIYKYYVDVALLNQLNRDQLCEIMYDIRIDLESYEDDDDYDPHSDTVINCKLCLNILYTYYILRFNPESKVGLYCD